MERISKLMNAETLRSLITYDADTGLISCKKGRRGVKENAFSRCVDSCGYLHMTIFGKSYRLHRLAWLYAHGKWPRGRIDHINGIKTDNRLSNLRECIAGENARNVRRRKDNTTGVTGVTWCKQTGKFRAQIHYMGKTRPLGRFDSFVKAWEARLVAEVSSGLFTVRHGAEN